MTTHTTEPRPHQTQDDDPSNPWRTRIVLTVATVALTAGIAATVLTSHDSGETGGSNNPDKFGDPNPYISSLTIEEGARLRADPFVAEDADGSTNLLATTDAAIPVNIIQGVDKVYTPEGKFDDWVGITASSLPDLDLTNDKDGIVWVSLQKASVKYDEDQ